MSRLLSTLALLIAFDGAAARTLELLEYAAELTLDEVALPATLGGTINYKECAACTTSTHTTTAATVFLVNGQALPFADFLRVVTEIRIQNGKEENTVLTVFLDIPTGHVTRVSLFD